jgi:pyruvate dehydrogenase E2 component (dihydrolipoamide acetyltransferase)
MSTNVALPPAMENGTLVRWVKNAGAAIRIGDVLAEIETDKTVMELEATQEGVLSKILVAEGTAGLTPGLALAVLNSKEEEAVAQAPPEPRASPEVGHAATPVEPKRSGRIFASPRAKRLAREASIDLAALKGSGPHGRIIERDIEAAKTNGHAQPAAREASPLPKLVPISPPAGPAPFTDVPHTLMRRTIAQRLTESKQTIPHFYLNVDCKLDALLAVKSELNREPNTNLTVNDFLIKAWAKALAQVPDANVTWTDKALRRYTQVDVGVAVAIPGGLITPIVQHADSKSLATLSNEVKDLAGRARERKLRPEEYEGGTTTISNLGMLGIQHFSAIVNPPQTTILAVGAAEKRIVVKNDAPAVATVLSCTLSVDHRAVDGAVGAAALQEFKRLIEHPLALLI